MKKSFRAFTIQVVNGDLIKEFVPFYIENMKTIAEQIDTITNIGDQEWCYLSKEDVERIASVFKKVLAETHIHHNETNYTLVFFYKEMVENLKILNSYLKYFDHTILNSLLEDIKNSFTDEGDIKEIENFLADCETVQGKNKVRFLYSKF